MARRKSASLCLANSCNAGVGGVLGGVGCLSAGWSAGYGALAVLVPAALFARGVLRHKNVQEPGVAMLRFFGWEMVKIILTVAILVAAPRVVVGLSWLALVAGMVLTMKTYWIALVVQSRRSKLD